MRAFPVNTTPILTPDVSIHRGELGAAPEIRLGERPKPARGCDASATVHTAPLSGSGQGAHGEVGHGKRALGCYGVCLPTELSWRMPDIGSAQLDQPVLRRQCSDVSIASASSRSVTKRRWSELDRAKHSAACRAKSRLTLNEKLEIIRLFESTDLAERKTQKELAELFGKSRMTISSVLRPDSIARCRQMAAGGVRGDATALSGKGERDGIVAWSPERLQTLRAQGTPGFVDVTADWCITCLANEQAVLFTDDMTRAFETAGVTYMVADWTNYDPDIGAFVREHGRNGIPLYVMYPGNLSGTPTLLPQLLTANIVTEALASVSH